MRIALATCKHHEGLVAGDDDALIEQLAPLDMRGERAVWDDPSVDWSAFDACLIRTTWDYMDRPAEFLDWLRRVEATIPTFNGVALARPNLDKSYLLDVERSGAPIVPTVWLPRGAGVDPASAARDRGWSRVVIKPSVGAGASGMLIDDVANDELLRAHVSELHALCDAFIQPFIPGVVERGELSLVYFDNEFSHAVRKRPAEGEVRVQIEFGGQYTLEDPAPAALDVAMRSLQQWEETPLYARIDLVEPAPGEYVVIEVELVEPELFFPWAPEAGARLGAALRRRLDARR